MTLSRLLNRNQHRTPAHVCYRCRQFLRLRLPVKFEVLCLHRNSDSIGRAGNGLAVSTVANNDVIGIYLRLVADLSAMTTAINLHSSIGRLAIEPLHRSFGHCVLSVSQSGTRIDIAFLLLARNNRREIYRTSLYRFKPALWKGPERILCDSSIMKAQCRLRLKLRRTQYEHMFSTLPRTRTLRDEAGTSQRCHNNGHRFTMKIRSESGSI